jgi:hypothetical protein
MLKKLLGTASSDKDTDKTIIVVSGLPRSGTSLMMNMLAAGGLSVLTDSLRSADDDNPNGYFEFEPVKQLANGQSGWLSEANHRVVKVISALLEHLPKNCRYKVLFMERDLKEILASQRKMLARRHEETRVSDAEMEEQFQKHLAATKYWLARQPNMDVLYVDYNKMMSGEEDYYQAIADFLAFPLDIPKMRSVPNAQLYRNRAES